MSKTFYYIIKNKRTRKKLIKKREIREKLKMRNEK